MLTYIRSAWISYRSLLTWLRGASFFADKIFFPLTQVVFLVMLGTTYRGASSRPYFLVGNALLVTTFGGVYGMSVCIRQARATGLLAYLALAPQSRLRSLANLSFFNWVDGLITGALVLVISFTLFGIRPHSGAGLVVALLLTAFSATALGLLVSNVSLAIEEEQPVLMNVAFFVTLVLSGSNVVPSELPSPLRSLTAIWPMSHGVTAGRLAVTGSGAPWRDVACEALVGLTLLALALVLNGAVDRRIRRTGRLLPGQ